MNNGTALAESWWDDGFRVHDRGTDEVVVTIGTTTDVARCSPCGVSAAAHDRMAIAVRDLACFGRPARLVWRKRRWRVLDPLGGGQAEMSQRVHDAE